MTDKPNVQSAGTKKGILKLSSSKGQQQDKEMKWDEMNILATYHPADKDYGHQKIDEPPTPYNRCSDEENEDVPSTAAEAGGIDPLGLADSLKTDSKPKALTRPESSGDEDDEEFLTEEEKEKRRKFKEHRKQHYNEFQNVRLARQLLAKDNEENDDNNGSGDKKQVKAAGPADNC